MTTVRTPEDAPVVPAERLRFLARPQSYPGDAGPTVEIRETHLSYVFLTRDRAYKLKKPVAHAFADLRSLAAREANCRIEVALNRRLAPDVYLGVIALVRGSDGALHLGGEGTVVDWLVHMRRLPEERMLDQVIEHGELSAGDIAALAGRLGAFFAGLAPVDISIGEYIGHLRDELLASVQVLATAPFRLPVATLRAVSACLQRYLDDGADLAERVRSRRIVEGHGDLRPEHVCLLATPLIIDCLEFSRVLRQVDPFDEIAFLGIECERLGASWVGPALAETIATHLRDHPPPRLLAFYAALRACVRARLAAAHLLEPEPRTPAKWLPRARDYLERAERACLVLS